MYKDILATVNALGDLKASIANNKVSKSQIENLSAGLQNDNIEINKTLETKFNPNLYSDLPSSISVEDAHYLVRRVEDDIIDLADNNRIEALKNAIASITYLSEKIDNITSTRDISLDVAEDIKKYYNRPKKKLFVNNGALSEEIESEFIPLQLFSNREQLVFLKELTVEYNREANYLLEEIVSSNPVEFHPFLNWIIHIVKDASDAIENRDWSLVFREAPIGNIDTNLLVESIIDGRLSKTLITLKKELEKKLTFAILRKADLVALKVSTKEISDSEGSFSSLSILEAGEYDKMYKDSISLLFLEFLYTLIYSKVK